MGDSAQNRNRRMFGNLLGHLNSARTVLNRDQTLFDRQVVYLSESERSASWSRRPWSASAKRVNSSVRPKSR